MFPLRINTIFNHNEILYQLFNFYSLKIELISHCWFNCIKTSVEHHRQNTTITIINSYQLYLYG